MSLDIRTAVQQLQAAGRFLYENQLAWGNAGNLSARVENTRCLITASGTRLGDLAEHDLVAASITFTPGEAFARRPSKELEMHRAVYAARPEVNAVLHAAPFYSTLAACADLPLPGNWFVEDMYYLERVARIPYAHPGSQALAEAVGEKAIGANILLLENHGVLVFDSSIQEALMALQVLEIVARMAITAQSAGLKMQPVAPEAVADFLTHSGYRPPRRWREPLDNSSVIHE